VNPHRLELAKKAGIPMAVDTQITPLKEVQAQLKMREGFDVGLEMSGSPAAFREMLENMCHGGKIAMLEFRLRKWLLIGITSSSIC